MTRCHVFKQAPKAICLWFRRNLRIILLYVVQLGAILWLGLNAIFECCHPSPLCMLIIAIAIVILLLVFHFAAYSGSSFSALSKNVQLHDDWGIRRIYRGEISLRILRIFVYIFAAAFLLLILAKKMPSFLPIPDLFRHKENLSTLILFFGLSLLLCLYQSLQRLTFRSLPVVALAVSAMLLFFCITGKAYAPNQLWGLNSKGIDLSELSNQIERFQLLIAGSAFASAILAVVFFLGKDVYEKYKLHQTQDSIKDIRRKLLTHWRFGSLFFLHDILIPLSVVIILICLGTIVLTMPEKEAVANGSTNMLLSYLALMASTLAFFGIVTHFDISDKALAASEYQYLQYHCIWLSNRQRKNRSSAFKEPDRRRWSDYLQVLSNLFLNTSPILSENREWHRLNHVLKMLHVNSDDCGRIALLSKCVFTYSSILKAQTAVEKEKTKSPTPSLSDPPSSGTGRADTHCASISETERLFAKEIRHLFDSSPSNTDSFGRVKMLLQKTPDDPLQLGKKYPYDISMVDALDWHENAMLFLQHLDRRFFDSSLKRALQRQLSVTDISTDEFIQVVRLDLLNIATHWQQQDDCLFHWLCVKTEGCPCERVVGQAVEESRHNRRVFFLEYPFLACQCIENRWPDRDSFDRQTTRRQVAAYFSALASEVGPLTVGDTSELNRICNEFCAFVRRNVADIFADAAVTTLEQFSAKKQNLLSQHSQQVYERYGLSDMSIGPWRDRDNLLDDSASCPRGTLSNCRNLVYLTLAKKTAQSVLQ